MVALVKTVQKVKAVHEGQDCSQRSKMFTKVKDVHEGQGCSQRSRMFTIQGPGRSSLCSACPKTRTSGPDR